MWMMMLEMLAAAGIALWLQQKFFQIYSRRGLSAEVYFDEEELNAGEKSTISIIVTNRKNIPLSAVSLAFRVDKTIRCLEEENSAVSDYTYRYDVFSIGGYEKVRRVAPILCQKRGYYEIQDLELSTSDLFYRKQFHKECHSDSVLYVYPAAVPAELSEKAARKIYGEVTARRFLVEDPYEFRGLREYQPYDEMRYINWKASARCTELMVMQKGSMSDQKVVILLNAASDDGDNRILVEKGISIAYALAEHLIREGIQTGLISNGRDRLDGKTIYLEAGAARSHVEAIGRCLARLIETSDQTSFASCIKERILSEENQDTVYVVISEVRNRNAVADFPKLAEVCEGSQMILVKRIDDKTEDLEQLSENIMMWEVPYA